MILSGRVVAPSLGRTARPVLSSLNSGGGHRPAPAYAEVAFCYSCCCNSRAEAVRFIVSPADRIEDPNRGGIDCRFAFIDAQIAGGGLRFGSRSRAFGGRRFSEHYVVRGWRAGEGKREGDGNLHVLACFAESATSVVSAQGLAARQVGDERSWRALRALRALLTRSPRFTGSTFFAGFTDWPAVALELLEDLWVDLFGRVDQVVLGRECPARH